jgi:hypothetical protein
LLPDSLRPLVEDVAERMQVPLDLPAVALVTSFAGAVNRRVAIQPKEHDTSWIVIPNLWGALVARPGFLKSPLMNAITKPLLNIENRFQKENAAARAKYRQEMDRWKQSKKAGTIVGGEPGNPTEKRIIVNDPTFEKLHEIMRDTPAGVFAIRDELTGWLAGLERAGREGERAFYLSAWNGDTAHTIDRIRRGSIYVPACCLSMLGGIQPELLRSYLAGARGVSLSDDGLIQRFQLLVWPDFPSAFEYVDRLPDQDSLQQVEERFERLVKLDPEKPLCFRFSPDAQGLFVVWLEQLETRLRGNSLPSLLASHLAKYRSLMPSLALLLELADRTSSGFVGSVGFPTPPHIVSEENTSRAWLWCEYLESQARRIYSCATTPAQYAAKELGHKILQGTLDSVFTPREVVQKGWRGLDSTESVTAACDELAKAAGFAAIYRSREQRVDGLHSYTR